MDPDVADGVLADGVLPKANGTAPPVGPACVVAPDAPPNAKGAGAVGFVVVVVELVPPKPKGVEVGAEAPNAKVEGVLV